MQKKPFTRGFTLIELLVVISIIAMLAAGAYGAFGLLMPKFKANAASTKAQTVYKMLAAYAIDSAGDYPDVQGDANANYKVLFQKKLMDSGGEKQFSIDGDRWCVGAPGGAKGANGDIGFEPEFAQALEPGELSWVYVGGQTQSSESGLPLMANAFKDVDSAGVYTKEQSKPGGILAGQKAVVTFLSGSSQVLELESSDYTVKGMRGGQKIPIFSAEFGTNMDGLRHPDPAGCVATGAAPAP
jgi:prepilin-type N-terminal cleavage/methylation domain-containing protein